MSFLSCVFAMVISPRQRILKLVWFCYEIEYKLTSISVPLFKHCISCPDSWFCHFLVVNKLQRNENKTIKKLHLNFGKLTISQTVLSSIFSTINSCKKRNETIIKWLCNCKPTEKPQLYPQNYIVLTHCHFSSCLFESDRFTTIIKLICYH